MRDNLCVYRPPPSARIKLTTSNFVDEFAKFLYSGNIPLENVLVVADFNFQIDKPNDLDTRRCTAIGIRSVCH